MFESYIFFRFPVYSPTDKRYQNNTALTAFWRVLIALPELFLTDPNEILSTMETRQGFEML